MAVVFQPTGELVLSLFSSPSPWICVGFLPQTKVMQVRLIGDWKFPKGDKASVNIYELR